jgi:cephalosporin hydroxylase
VLSQLPEEVDVVFVDTDHRYELTLEEIRTYAPRVRSGGCMVFHDTQEESFEHHTTEQPPFPVRTAVQELLGGESPIRGVAKIETWENNHGLTVVWFD